MRHDPASFLRAVAAEPWQVGWSDCVGTVARWLAAQGHDAALALLPPAGDGAAADDWLACQGGLCGAMRAGAERLGLSGLTLPEIGAVAHLDLVDGRETAAIWGRSAWMMRTRGGIAALRPRAIATATIWGL